MHNWPQPISMVRIPAKAVETKHLTKDKLPVSLTPINPSKSPQSPTILTYMKNMESQLNIDPKFDIKNHFHHFKPAVWKIYLNFHFSHFGYTRSVIEHHTMPCGINRRSVFFIKSCLQLNEMTGDFISNRHFLIIENKI